MFINAITSKSKQSGITLIESLVALVVLALGVMGLAGVQTRLLVESRTANSRAVAVGLIDDLTNRMLLNKTTAFPPPPTVSGYQLAGFQDINTNPTAAQDCSTNSCTGTQMAQSDINLWRIAVNNAFPSGQVSILQPPVGTNQNQIGIAIAWTENEKAMTNSAGAQDAQTALDQTANRNTFAATIGGAACPATFICHVVFVQP